MEIRIHRPSGSFELRLVTLGCHVIQMSVENSTKFPCRGVGVPKMAAQTPPFLQPHLGGAFFSKPTVKYIQRKITASGAVPSSADEKPGSGLRRPEAREQEFVETKDVTMMFDPQGNDGLIIKGCSYRSSSIDNKPLPDE